MYSKKERVLAKNECCNHMGGVRCLMYPAEGCRVLNLTTIEKCKYFEKTVKPLDKTL